MPWPAVALLTGRGVFGFSLSNQGNQFYWEQGSVQIPVRVLVAQVCCLTYAPRSSSACVSVISESHSAALRSLLHCWDLIRVLADRTVHRSEQGCLRDPAVKTSQTQRLWCLTTGSIKEGRFTWKCFGKHNWSFKQAEGWCVFVDVTHSVYIHLFYLSLVWESLLFFTVLSPVFALSFLGCTQSGGGVTQVSLLVHKSFPMRERVIRGSHTLVQTNKHELLWWKAWIAAKLLTLYCILRIFNTCLLWLHGHYARVGNG